MGFDKTESESTQTSQVMPAQEKYLEMLWKRGQKLLQSQIGPVGDQANQLAGEFMPFMRQSLGQLGQLAQGQGVGQQYLAGSLGQENPYLQDVIGGLREDIGQGLGRELGVGIAGEAGGVGGAYGGSRHGIREGMAIESANREFANAAADLRFGDYAAQGARAEALTQSQSEAARQLGGLAPDAFNLGISPLQAPWIPYQMQGRLLGAPTVLGQGQSESQGFGFSF